MKVVLFCGGMGMRIREHSSSIPKPMVPIGGSPIVWHLMEYYAHFGHTEFILCLGWQADVVRRYFEEHPESVRIQSPQAGERVQQFAIDQWKVTLVDTGLDVCIGERLLAVREHVVEDEAFLANYVDGLADLHLPVVTEPFLAQSVEDSVASFLCVRPSQSFHRVQIDDDGCVTQLKSIRESDVWMNGGYFVFRREIFDYLLPGEDLVNEPFERLLAHGYLIGVKHEGFWACMDTYKEMQEFEQMCVRDEMPWQVWRKKPSLDSTTVDAEPAVAAPR